MKAAYGHHLTEQNDNCRGNLTINKEIYTLVCKTTETGSSLLLLVIRLVRIKHRDQRRLELVELVLHAKIERHVDVLLALHIRIDIGIAKTDEGRVDARAHVLRPAYVELMILAVVILVNCAVKQGLSRKCPCLLPSAKINAP